MPGRAVIVPMTRKMLILYSNNAPTTDIYTLSLHDALPISSCGQGGRHLTRGAAGHPEVDRRGAPGRMAVQGHPGRSEEHTSELQSRPHLVCRLLLEKKNPENIAYLTLGDPDVLVPCTPLGV